MNRHALAAGVLLTLCGCQVSQEREALSLLPADVEPVPYTDLVARARVQANLATEAFYTDDWLELEDAARALEQTARYLPQSSEPPAPTKDRLPEQAVALGKAARDLREAARARNVEGINTSLQHVRLGIRTLHPGPVSPPPAPEVLKP